MSEKEIPVIKDSGIREEFDTGSKRDTRDGKGRFDLLPTRAIARLARHFESGAKKYGDRNWENGIKYSRVMGALKRHLDAWWDNEDTDPESGNNHLYHVLCNAMFLAHYVSYPKIYKDFDDRPHYEPKEKE